MKPSRKKSARPSRKFFAWAALLCFLVAVPSAAATTRDTADTRPRGDGTYFSAWLPYWDNGTGIRSFAAHTSRFSQLRVAWYAAKDDTTIANNARGRAQRDTLRIAKHAKVDVLATVTDDFDTATFLAIANSTERRARHVNALCTLAKSNGYAGIDMDYETFALKANAKQTPLARTAYNTLLRDIGACVHAAGKTFSVTIAARVDIAQFPELTGATWSTAFDYETIGTIADTVTIMAYDYATAGSPANAVAPMPWVHGAVEYATKRIAPQKLILGVPLYGRQWTTDAKGKVTSSSLTIPNAQKLSRQKNVTPQRDERARSLTFRYSEDNKTTIAWYDDTLATSERIQLGVANGWKGSCAWSLGSEDSSFWKL